MNYFLVVLVVNNPDHVSQILDAWEEAGIPGITILESTGIGHLSDSGLRDDLPLLPTLRSLMEGREVQHRTLLSVVSDEGMVDEMVRVSQEVIGNLDDHHTGFLFVTPVLRVHGLGRHLGGDRGKG